ncbi:MAG: hypothetical protein GQ574_20650 [Crocinitomix sp.]|nr:hypothetical protein [Crocinitomix sp.]
MAKKGKHITREDRKNTADKIAVWEKSIEASLKKSNLKGVSFEKKIRGLADRSNNNTAWTDTVNGEIFSGFFQFRDNKDKKKRTVFTELLLHLDQKNCGKLLDNDACIIGLIHMTTNHNKFIREIETWEKSSHNPLKQFSSLLRHLFCAYPVPEFLDSAWLESEGKEQRNWLTAMGVGISIRKLNHVPINMTKKVAHAFGKAPSNLTVSEALRWAQVVGKGGDERLANFILRSRLSRNEFVNEKFWDGAILFMINAGMFDYEKIAEIIDFLIAQRTINRAYSLKGRTIPSIIRGSDAWHNDQENMRQRGGKLIWTSSNIAEAYYDEGKDEKQVSYSILELRSTKELLIEGRKMNHCVATYASSCYRKKSAIFSIRKKPALSNEETLATLEISLQGRRIVQAKARYNKTINNKALTLMKSWAKKENLQIPSWI